MRAFEALADFTTVVEDLFEQEPKAADLFAKPAVRRLDTLHPSELLLSLSVQARVPFFECLRELMFVLVGLFEALSAGFVVQHHVEEHDRVHVSRHFVREVVDCWAWRAHWCGVVLELED